MSPEPGMTLGPYSVTATIGEGGMDFRRHRIDSRTPAAFT
jgi:hypothetical protein